MAFAALTIDLNARLASFEEGLKRAERAATDSAGRMERAFGLAGKGLAALGGVLSVGMLTGFARNAVASAAALDDLAEATGSSVEGLSKLVDIARIGGGDIDTVGSVIAALNKGLTNPNADENKGVGAALRAIGLNAEELLRLAPEKRIEAVAVALDGFADGWGKGNVVFQLFKRSAGEVVPFLNDVVENLDRASSVTREQAAEAERLEKNWNALAVSASNWARVLVGDLVPALNTFFQIASKGAGFGGAIDATLGYALRKKLWIGDKNIQAEIRQQQEKLDQMIEDREKSLTPLFRPTETDIENQKAYLAGLREVASIEAMILAAPYRDEARKPFLTFVPPKSPGAGARAKPDTYVADVFAASVGDLERFKTELDRTRRGFVELIEPQQRFLDQLNTLERMAPLLGISAEQVERIRDALRAQANETEFGKPLEDIVEKTAEANDLVKELGLTFTSAFEDAIAGGKGLRDILGGLEQDLMRLITRKLVTEPLGNAVSGALGGAAAGGFAAGFDKILGGLVVSLFGAKDGGIFPGGFQAFAGGGLVSRPTLGLVGEGAMNEAIVPLPNGRAIPVEMRGGGATVIMNISTPDAGSFRASQGQILADAQRALARGRRNL